MTVADEKDKLAPQLEEARWRNRQLEKDVQQLQETSAGNEQVLCFLLRAANKHIPYCCISLPTLHMTVVGAMHDCVSRGCTGCWSCHHAEDVQGCVHCSTCLAGAAWVLRQTQ